MMSLPLAFGTTVTTIPAEVPYLRADPAQVEAWGGQIAPTAPRVNVGLVWAGRPVPKGRSIPFERLAPLLDVPGVRFHSLQKGAASRDAAGSSVTDWDDAIQDFADTAALVGNLDLVITIDSAVAHLAGAMGRRTWVMLQFAPDWRWLRGRGDSPWYPTMRLFRQPSPGDWESVVRDVASELRAQVQNRVLMPMARSAHQPERASNT